MIKENNIMKTVCIYHSIDLDGWMSAAIVKHWFITNAVKNLLDINISNPNIIDFIGYNYGQPIPDLSEYDKVIMCDISFPKKDMLNLWETKGLNFEWIDHHISAIKEMDNVHENISSGIYPIQGLRDTNFAACELTWKYFFPNEPIPEIVRLLGRYDCFGHKFTNEDQDRLDTLLDVRDNCVTEQLHPYLEELDNLLRKKKEEQKVLEFQYGARQCISNYEEAYYHLQKCLQDQIYNGWEIEIHERGKSIYKYLCTEAKQTYKNGFEIKFLHNYLTNNQAISETVKFICINKERFNPINFGIDYHKDGYDGAACFHYANGMWNFSLYNDNGLVDCSVIAKQFGGGGHKGAAGFTIDDVNKIIK